MAYQNPITNIISKGGSSAAQNMAAASASMARTGILLDKGFSIPIKIDMLLKQEQDKRINQLSQVSNNMQNMYKMQMAEQAQQFSQDMQQRNYELSKDRLGLAVDQFKSNEEQKKFNRKAKAVSLMPDTVTNQFGIEVPNQRKTKAVNMLFRNAGLTPPPSTNTSANTYTAKPTYSLPKPTQADDIETSAGENTVSTTKYVPSSDKPLSVQDSLKVVANVNKSIAAGDTYSDEELEAIMNELDPNVAKGIGESIRRSAIASRSAETTLPKPTVDANTKNEMVTAVQTDAVVFTGKQDDMYIYPANSKPIPKYVAVDSNGKIISRNYADKKPKGTKIVVNPEAVIAQLKTQDIPTYIMNNVDEKNLNNYINATAKLRPDIILSPDNNLAMQNLLKAKPGAYNKFIKKAGGQLAANFDRRATYLEKQGKKEEANKAREMSKRINRLTSNMAKVDEGKISKQVDTTFSGMKDDLIKYMANITNLQEMADYIPGINYDKERAAAEANANTIIEKTKRIINEEMKTRGYSPTYTKLKAMKYVKSSIDRPFFGNYSLDINPLREFNKKVGKNAPKYNKAIFGTSTPHFAAGNDGISDTQQYADFIKEAEKQIALQDATSDGAPKNISMVYNGVDMIIPRSVLMKMIGFKAFGELEKVQ